MCSSLSALPHLPLTGTLKWAAGRNWDSEGSQPTTALALVHFIAAQDAK